MAKKVKAVTEDTSTFRKYNVCLGVTLPNDYTTFDRSVHAKSYAKALDFVLREVQAAYDDIESYTVESIVLDVDDDSSVAV